MNYKFVKNPYSFRVLGECIPKMGEVTQQFFHIVQNFSKNQFDERKKKKTILINIKVALFMYYHNVCWLFFVLSMQKPRPKKYF